MGGNNPDIQNASRTYVGDAVVIESDATDSGDGGKVIVWSDEITSFNGSISATGSGVSGNGGFVEVSGKQSLYVDGVIDVTAESGNHGTVLFDPTNIVVSIAGVDAAGEDGASGGDVLFGDAEANTVWDVTPAQLDGIDGNIILQAENDITITDAIDISDTNGATFVAQAGNTIDVNADITTDNALIHLEANSTHDTSGGGPTGTGIVDIDAGAALNSGGGNVTLIGNSFTIAGTIDAGGGDVAIAQSNNTGDSGVALSIGAGALTDTELDQISNVGTLTIGTAGTAGAAGDFAGSQTVTAGTITVDTAAVSLADNINLALTATNGIIISQNIDVGAGAGTPSGTGSLTLTSGGTTSSSGDITVGSGGIDINATSNVTALFSTTGNVITSGAIAIDANAGLNVTGGAIVRTTSAAADNVTLTADADSSGAGNLVVGGAAGAGTVESNNAGYTGTITLQGENVALGGAFAATVQSTNTGAVTINADRNNDGATGSITVDTNTSLTTGGGLLTLNNAFTADINVDVTSGGAFTISNIDSAIDLAQNVDLTATTGNLDLNDTVAAIDLDGAAGINILTATAGEVQAAAISDTGTPTELEINSGTNITLESIDINGLLDINMGGTTGTATGAITAGTVDIDGPGAGSTFIFGDATGTDTVTSNTAGITITDIDNVTLADGLSAQNGISISTVVNLNLSTDADITATTGNIDMTTSGPTLNLGGGTHQITASAGTVDILNVTDTAALTEFEVNGEGISVSAITFDNGGVPTLDINVDNNNSGSENVDINGDINIGTGVITIDGMGSDDVIQIGNNVDLTAAAISVGNGNIDLDGGGTNRLTASAGNIDIQGNITDSTAITELELNASNAITLQAVTLNNNTTNILDINVDTNGGGSTLTVNNTLNAGNITVDGTGTDDTMTFTGVITSTATSGTGLFLQNAQTVNFNGGITTARNIDVDNVGTAVNLNSGTTLTANGGTGIDLRDSVGSGITAVNLTGGGTVNIDSNGTTGIVQLAAVTDAGSENLTINSGSNTTIISVNMDGNGTLTVDAGTDPAVGGQATFLGAVTAGAIDVSGFGGNDSATFSGTVTANTGAIAIDTFSTVDLQNATAQTDLTVSANNIDLNNTTYTATTGLVTFTGAVDLELAGGTTTVTSGGGVGDDITFTSTIDELGTKSSLTLDAGTNGDVSLQAVGITNQIGAFTITGNDISFNGNVESDAIDVTAQEGADADSITIGAVTLDSNDSNMVFRSDDIIINAAANLISTGATTTTSITFTGETATSTIGLGTGAAGTLNLSEAELNRTDATIEEIIVGIDTTQSGTINVNDSGVLSIADSGLRLRAEAGDIDIDNEIALTTADKNFTIEGQGNTTLLSGDITTTGGDIVIMDSVLVDGNRTIDSGNGGTAATAGLIQITGAIGSVDTTGDILTITANGTVDGDVDIQSTVGSGTVNGAAANDLTGFTISAANQVDVNNIEVTSGNIAITGTNIDLNGATYQTTTSGGITFDAGGGTIELDQAGGTTTVQTAGNAGDDITISSSIRDGDATQLTLNAGADGDVTATSIGAVTAIGTVDIDGDQIDLNSINVDTGDILITGNNITLNSALTSTTSGLITVTGPVILGTTPAGSVTTAGNAGDNITFTSTIDDDAAGENTVAINAGTSGNVTIGGAVGGATRVGNTSISGDTVSVNSVRVDGTGSSANIFLGNVGGTNINLNGSNYDSINSPTSGIIRFRSDVTLNQTGGTTTVSSTSGAASDITFQGTVNDDAGGDTALVVNTGTVGDITFQQAIGGVIAIESLTITNANQFDVVNVTTTGAQSYTATNIDLNSTTYQVTTSGSVGFTGAVDLDAGAVTTVVTSAGGNDITFSSTIDDAITNDTTLSLQAGAGNVSVGGAIGDTAALASLDIDGNDISIANIGGAGAGVTGLTDVAAANQLTFTGTTYNANQANYAAAAGQNILVNGGAATTFTSTDDAIAFNTGNIVLADGSDLIVTSGGGAITALAIDGTSSEDVTLTSTGGTANTVSVGAIGTNTADGINTVGLTGSTSVTLNGDITTSNAAGNTVTVTGPALLGAGVTIDTDTAGTDGDINFTSTIDNAQALSLQSGGANVTVGGAIGDTAALASLDIDGNDISIANIGGAGAGVTGLTDVAAANQLTFTGTTYNANQANYAAAAGQNILVNGGAATTFTSTDDAIAFNTGNIVLADGSDLIVTSGGGAITALAIDGTSSEDVTLTSTGGTANTVSVGAIGTNTADGINTVGLTGSTSVTLNGDITTSNAAGNTVTVTGPALLGAGVTVTTNTAGTDGDINFTSTIDNAQALSLQSGGANVTVGGAIGDTAALASLDVDGNDISINDIGGAGAGVTGLTDVAAANQLTFTGTTYNANQANYAAAAGQNILVNGGAATTFTSTDDAIAFNTGNIVLADGSDLIVTSGGGAITALAIDGTSSEDVTLTSTGGTANTVSVGAIGTNTADGINTVGLTGSTSVTLNGDITTSNAAGNTVTVTGPALLGAGVTMTTDTAGTDGDINFTSTIDNAQALSLQSGGANVTVGGAIGDTAALASLDIDGNDISINEHWWCGCRCNRFNGRGGGESIDVHGYDVQRESSELCGGGRTEHISEWWCGDNVHEYRRCDCV